MAARSQDAPRTRALEQARIAEQLLKIDAIECRRSLKQFATSAWHIIEPRPFVDGWVVDAICEHLEAVTRGDIRRLVINIPPRHTKSTLLVLWRVWTWVQSPSERFLTASYNHDLSIRDNVRCRRIIEDPWFQERYSREFQIAGDQNAKSFFENSVSGYQMAVSMKSTTGQGGSYLVIDDAHNADEAHSDAERETALIWFREVWTNRLNDQERDKMVLVGQRIHENDVCGYVLRERPDWEHLNLPALFEPSQRCTTSIGWTDPRQQEGDLLWPERFSHATLDSLKRDLGTSGFAAQYQQTPVPAGGGQFKEEWMRYCQRQGDYYTLQTPNGPKHVAVADCWRFTVADLAISSKQEADYTVIQTWAVTKDADMLLIEQLRGHYDNPEQQKLLQLVYQRHIPDFLEIESVSYQLALIQQLLLKGIPCKEYKPVRDKVSRASTAAVYMEAGKIYFDLALPDLPDIKLELLRFPKYGHDDIVDDVSMAADIVSMPRPIPGALVLDVDPFDPEAAEEGDPDDPYSVFWRTQG